ncbi:MAG: VOC family protein, partial [Roseibium sp.]
MEQRISMITLVVDDIAETRRFFEDGLGWQVNEAPAPDVVFFQVIGGAFALYSRAALADEIGREVTALPFGATTIAWNGRTAEEVDEAYQRAIDAGGKAVKAPEKAFWGGYTSYVEV